MANLKDVAALAGVSVHTVSDILNCGDKRYRAETAEKVREAAKELGYRANRSAQSLRKKKTRTIGVISYGSTHELERMRLQHVLRAISRHSWFPLVCDPIWYEGGGEQIIDMLCDARISGLYLVNPSNLSKKSYLEIRKTLGEKIPVVSWGGEHLPGVMHYLSDKELAFKSLTHHLLSLGHRRITLLLSGEATLEQTMQMWHPKMAIRGYEAALKEHSPLLKSDVVFCHRSTWEGEGLAQGVIPIRDPYMGGYIGMKKILERDELPDAVIASNDSWAHGALRALRERGISVPSDMALVGCEDEMASAYGAVGLTTFRQPLVETADLSVEHLLRMVRGEKVAAEGYQVVKGELVVRNSCGSPSEA